MIAYVLEPEDRTFSAGRFRCGYFDNAPDIGRFGSACVSQAEVWTCSIPDELSLTVWYGAQPESLFSPPPGYLRR